MADGQAENIEKAASSGRGPASWSGAQAEGYAASGKAGTMSTAETMPLPGLEVHHGSDGHESVHAKAGSEAAGLDGQKDSKNGLDEIKKLDNWVSEKEKDSCLDSKQLADNLMKYAEDSVKSWTDKDGMVNPPDNAPDIYEHFDKLLHKLDELKSKDKDWNDENSPNSREEFYKKLPWHFAPGE